MDLDGDGNNDILSGSYSRLDGDMAGLFQILRGTPEGRFSAAEALQGTDGKPLIINTATPPEAAGYDAETDRICTRPTAVDWDADGDLDLLVGNFTGTFYVFNGEGQGRFQPNPVPVMVGNDLLRIPGAHSDPFCIDWDGDGDLDLLSGSSAGGVYLAENTAGPSAQPTYREFVTIIRPSQSEPGSFLTLEDLTGPQHSTRVFSADVNGDGKPDLLVGDNCTLISPADGVDKETARTKAAEWEKKMTEISRQLTELNSEIQAAVKGNSDSEDEAEPAPLSPEILEKQRKLYAEYSELYNERSTFIAEENTGFVWLYIRR